MTQNQLRLLSRGLSLAAVLAACAFMLALGARRLDGLDLGHHLAYGEQFLDSGRIVETNPFLYTLPEHALPESVFDDLRPDPGPGGWYDSDRSYHFVNANWLPQIAIALVKRAGGMSALWWFQLLLVAGVCVASLLIMWRLAVPWPAGAAGLLLIALVSHHRFDLRPDMASHVILAVQLCLLAWPGRQRAGLSLRRAIGLILLQLALVNSHDFFLLGLGLTLAFFLDWLFRLIWQRITGTSAPADQEIRRSDGIRLAGTLVLQTVVCFVNPWSWRLAILPFATLRYIGQHEIAGADPASGVHPWSTIADFQSPFAEVGLSFSDSIAHAGAVTSNAYLVLLVLAGLGIVAAAAKRHWHWLLLLLGMVGVSLSMQRNVAAAGVLVVPVALAALSDLGEGLARRRRAAIRVVLTIGIPAVLAVVCIWLAFSVVTQRFYYGQLLPTRFGATVSPIGLSQGPTAWLNKHDPAGRLWTGFKGSSNLHYFTEPQREVPILGDLRAYPPLVMDAVLKVSNGQIPLTAAIQSFDIQITTLWVDGASSSLGRWLVDDPGWSLVFLEGPHVIFLRNDGPDSLLAEQFAMSPGTLAAPDNVAQFAARLASLDPIPAQPVFDTAITLWHLGWRDAALPFFLEAVELDPRHYVAWNWTGVCLFERAKHRIASGDSLSGDDLTLALRCFEQSLSIRKDYDPARENLESLKSTSP